MYNQFSEEEGKRIGFLQTLCNKYGDFRVTYLKRNQEGIETRKWRSVMTCWESDEGLRFLAQANNREPVIIETFLDIDTDDKEEAKEIMNDICDVLTKYGEKHIAYDSGSKGYHIHLYNKSMINMTLTQREEWRKIIISLMKCDPLKSSEKHMLAIENIPHWKTGVKKVRVRGNWEG